MKLSKFIDDRLHCLIPLIVCLSMACGESSPTTPSNRTTIQSFAASTPLRIATQQVPDHAGVWAGEYLLTACRSAYAGACKDAPRREALRVELTQQGVDLRGTIDFLGSRKALTGFVSEGPGVAGFADNGISVRLTQSGTTLVGMLVNDNVIQSLLNLSKRYDIVTPLQRIE